MIVKYCEAENKLQSLEIIGINYLIFNAYVCLICIRFDHKECWKFENRVFRINEALGGALIIWTITMLVSIVKRKDGDSSMMDQGIIWAK